MNMVRRAVGRSSISCNFCKFTYESGRLEKVVGNFLENAFWAPPPPERGKVTSPAQLPNLIYLFAAVRVPIGLPNLPQTVFRE